MERHQKIKICDNCKKELVLELEHFADYSDSWIKVEGEYNIFYPNSNTFYRRVLIFVASNVQSIFSFL